MSGDNVLGLAPSVPGNFVSYVDSTGLLVQDSTFNSSSFLKRSGDSMNGDLDMKSHVIYNGIYDTANFTGQATFGSGAQIALNYQSFTAAAGGGPYTIDTTYDVIYVDSSNAPATMQLGQPAINKRIAIRLKYQFSMPVTIEVVVAGGVNGFVLDSATPCVELAWTGAEWYLLTESSTLGDMFPQRMQSPTSVIASGMVGNATCTSLAVSNDGQWVAAGYPAENSNLGCVVMWRWTPTIWTQFAKIVGTGSVGGAQQGYSLCFSADGYHLFVGGRADNGNIGAVWTFIFDGANWIAHTARIYPTGYTAVGGVFFGCGISCNADGSTLFVTASNDTAAGALYVFTYDVANFYAQTQRIPGTAGQLGVGTITTTSIGDIVVVSTPTATGSVGAIELYKAADTTNQSYSLFQTFVPTQTPVTNQFGTYVALSADGKWLLVNGLIPSVNAIGQNWILDLATGEMRESAIIVGSGSVGAGSGQGITSNAISASGNVCVIGGYADDTSKGAVWLFRKQFGPNNNWVQVGPKITAPFPAVAEYFGAVNAISPSGSVIAIAPYAGGIAPQAYALYLYR